jgi:hypothetical protein
LDETDAVIIALIAAASKRRIRDQPPEPCALDLQIQPI